MKDANRKDSNPRRGEEFLLRYRLSSLLLFMILIGALLMFVLTLGQPGYLWWPLFIVLVGVIARLNKHQTVGRVFIVIGLVPIVLYVIYLVVLIVIWQSLSLDP